MSSRIYVVKLGTSILKAKSGSGLDLKKIQALAKQVIAVRKKGAKIIIVSSGAIALGMQLLKLKIRPKKLAELQAAASVGQGMLIKIFGEIFRKSGLEVAQILLTYDDFNDRQRYLNAKNTFLHLLAHDVVPIVNENDTVSTEEIKVGDNDKLSALVASMVEAKILLILSNVDGLYDENGKIIEVVSNIDANVCKVAKGTTEQTSVGGMNTKLEAASITCNAGIPCIVANGNSQNIVVNVIDNNFKGTSFLPSPDKMVAKKRWLAFGSKPKGKIIIDDGAKNAILSRKSLLAVGITGVEGKFEVGDVVSVYAKEKEVARGISRIASEELRAVKGTRFKNEIIHCDNLAVVQDLIQK